MDWVEEWTPDRGRGQYWLKFAPTTINSPIETSNQTADGAFYPNSRELNSYELKGLCGIG